MASTRDLTPFIKETKAVKNVTTTEEKSSERIQSPSAQSGRKRKPIDDSAAPAMVQEKPLEFYSSTKRRRYSEGNADYRTDEPNPSPSKHFGAKVGMRAGSQ
ncbi:hypothetical protein HK102_002341 [Quaeritorhiza haematococci]|nr:hypothetical protein HK102_002341 [Quaeritorhiza haematococci]